MRTLKFISALFLVALLMNGCLYNFIVPEPDGGIDPDDPDAPTVSFATDIQPIFTSKCVACHDNGGDAPNLEAGSAYSAIANSKYINSATPASSLIYTFPSPTSNTHGWKEYSTSEANLVLAWITQGAEDN